MTGNRIHSELRGAAGSFRASRKGGRPGEPGVSVERLVRVNGRGDGAVRALDGITPAPAPGTFTAV